MNHIEKLSTDVHGAAANVAKCAHLKWSADDAVALDADGVMTSTAGATSAKTVTEDLVSPAVPRALEVVVGGTAGDAKAGSKVTVFGTNIADAAISEDFTLTGDQTETLVGAKAFKTVNKVVIGAQDGTGVTFTVGWVNKLGLPYKFTEKPLVFALLDGARQTTDPTLVIDDDEIEKNTITLSSSLNGKQVDAFIFI